MLVPTTTRPTAARTPVGRSTDVAMRPHRTTLLVRDERTAPAPLVVAARSADDPDLHQAIGRARAEGCSIHVVRPTTPTIAMLGLAPLLGGPAIPLTASSQMRPTPLDRLLESLRQEGIVVEEHATPALRLRRYARKVAVTIGGRILS